MASTSDRVRAAAVSLTSRNVTRVAFWIAVGLAFGVWVAVAKGPMAAAEY